MMLWIKLLAIASFVGGPLVLLDWLAPRAGEPVTFVLMFAPCALLVFAVLAWHDEPSRMQTLTQRGGQLGAVLLLVQNAVASFRLTQPGAWNGSAGMSVGGIVIGTGVALSVLYLRQRTPPPFDFQRELARALLWSRLRDYGLLAVCLTFVVSGLVIFQRDRDVGVTTIVFFAACGVVPIRNFRRRRQQASLLAAPARPALTLPADRTLRPRRRTLLLVQLSIVAGALLILAFSSSYPALFRLLILSVAAAAVIGITLTVLGKLPRGYIRFDELGLTLGRRRHALHVPWSALEGAVPGEYFDNPVVLLVLDDLDAVTSTPSQPADRLRRQLQRSDAFAGAPLLIMTSLYDVDPDTLAFTIEQHRLAAHAQGQQDESTPQPPSTRRA